MEIEAGRAAAQFMIGETRFTVFDHYCIDVSEETAEMLLRELAEEFYPSLTTERRGEVKSGEVKSRPPNRPHKKGGAGQD